MLRPKRQHSSYNSQHHGHSHHHSHHHADDHHGGLANDDELMRMNPSLMTERQQLAFLLRKTAQDASSSSSDSAGGAHESSSDDDDGRGHHAKGAAGRRIPANNTNNNKSSPRNTTPTTSQQAGDVVIYCGRGRPPKNSIKLPPGQSSDEYKKQLLSPKSASLAKKQTEDHEASDRVNVTHPPTRKKLKVRTASSLSSSSTASDAITIADKISPSSSSDILHMDAYVESDSNSAATVTTTKTSGGTDFWRLHCALCCDKTRAAALDAFCSDALFLCPSCDQKYPTQRALGRV